MWIAVCELFAVEEKSAFLKITLNCLLGFLEIFATNKLRTIVIKISLCVEHRNHWQINLESEIKVVFSINNGRVYVSCSIFGCYKIGSRHVMRFLSSLLDRRQIEKT